MQRFSAQITYIGAWMKTDLVEPNKSMSFDWISYDCTQKIKIQAQLSVFRST